MKTLALTLSLFLNIILGSALVYLTLEGCAEVADGRLGVLTQDVAVGVLGEHKTIFTLPKGLQVRDASATGLDRFEPYRFRLVVTSEAAGLVDYSPQSQPPQRQHGELYSADIHSQQ